MKPAYFKTGAAALLLSSVFFPTGMSASSDLEASSHASATTNGVNYGRMEHIQAAVKNASVVPTETGSRLSVTVRLYNGGKASTRIPEHEFRVLMNDGVMYTLTPSVGNKPVLQPNEIVELVYSRSVDVKNIGAIEQVRFVHINWDVYPKQEKTLLAIPVESVWYGMGEGAPAKPKQIGWGRPFQIPGVNSGLVYTPAEASVQNTSGGKAVVVKVIAENPGKGRESIPSFRIDGVAGQKIYSGQASPNDVKSLEAGEKDYLRYIIPIEQGVSLTELLVVSEDSFVSQTGAVTISTGKLAIAWSDAKQSSDAVTNYRFGEPIRIDTLANAVDTRTEVTLMDFHIHENAEEGYKTAVAKFKLTNRSDLPVAAPVFGTEITNSQGVSYRGSRQANMVATMNPGLAYVVSYSYTLPQNEEDNQYTMRLLDQTTIAPYTTTVASLRVQKQEDGTDNKFSLYPFEIHVNDIQIGFLYSNGLYQYKFDVDMTIHQQDPVVVDSGFSKLRFEVVDSTGRIVGTKDAALFGPNKLISGKQELETGNMNSDQFNYPFTVNLYEVIETETGTAKRFLNSVK